MKKQRGIRKPKGWKPGDINTNLYLASYEHIPGNDSVSGEVVQLWNDCDGIFHARKKYRNKFLQILADDILGRIQWAIDHRDGNFFRDLARLCENPCGKISLRFWLILTHWELSKGWQAGRKQDYHYTAVELCNMAEERGIVKEIMPKRMHEICAQLGIKLKRAKGWKRKIRRTSI